MVHVYYGSCKHFRFSWSTIKKIQGIWSSTADMLDFLKDTKDVIIDTLKTNPGLTTIVTAMMKQIYDCASFLREYAGKGFLRQLLVQSDGLKSY
jgi:hypothetical protein